MLIYACVDCALLSEVLKERGNCGVGVSKCHNAAGKGGECSGKSNSHNLIV